MNRLNEEIIGDSSILKYIYEQYSDPTRKYHTNVHIDRMIDIVEEHDIEISTEQLWALLCHDVFYYPGDPLNEDKSAHFATMFMKMRDYEDADIKIVETIIMDTKTHIPTIEESKVIIDLDLWDLSDPERFRAGSQLIEMEFVPIIDSGAYHVGRIDWLKKFLARDTIFVSEYSTDRMEETARRNLQYELEHLEQLGFPGCT